MNTMSRAIVGLVVAASALPALAQEVETRPYASVMYDTVFSDKDRKAESGNGYSFGVGKALSKYWGLEIGGFYDQAKPQAGGNSWREYGGKIDGMFFYSRNPRFSPYAAIGVGGMENDLRTTGNKSFDVFADAGVGFMKYFPITAGYDVGFRADARYRWVNAKDIPGNHSFGEPVVRVGLVFPFGKRAATIASASGAAAAAAPVMNAGKGNEGSSAEDVARSFEDVHFEFDHSDLTDLAKAMLDNDATALNALAQKNPEMKVDLSGHTDWIGTEGYNQALSERRADSVKQYLIRKGVDAGRITTHAYGETRPVAPNDTAEGRAKNRRVEIRTDAQKK